MVQYEAYIFDDLITIEDMEGFQKQIFSQAIFMKYM